MAMSAKICSLNMSEKFSNGTKTPKTNKIFESRQTLVPCTGLVFEKAYDKLCKIIFFIMKFKFTVFQVKSIYGDNL